MEQVSFSVGNEGRQVFWNAHDFEWLLYGVSLVALAIFAYGLYRRWTMGTAIGKPETRTDRMGERLKALFLNSLVQVRTCRELYPGIMHGLIFFGFLVLFLGSAVDATEFHITEPFGIAFLRGMVYLIFSFLMDLFGLFIFIGVLLALYRRYIQRPERLAYREKGDNTPDDAVVLVLIALIVATGFVVDRKSTR